MPPLSLRHATVSAGSAVVVVAAILTFTVKQVAWQTTINLKLEEITQDVKDVNKKIVGNSAQGWHKSDMRAFVREAGIMNPELRLPPVRNSFDE